MTYPNLYPTDVMISSLTGVKITLPVICCNTSAAAPAGLSPGFLSNGIKRQARNASKDNARFSTLHNFLIN